MSATPPLIRSLWMMSSLRLVIFDVDGTLVDSEALIYLSFMRAYESMGLAAPAREDALNHVGITLDHIFPLATAYREAYHAIHKEQGDRASSPFFPGARAALDALKAQDWTLLAIATGKAQRGLDAMITGHGLEGYFQSAQSADGHPSKPHPSMIHTCLAETGVVAAQTVMIGDTTFDMDMGRAAGVKTIGVSWGHHPVERLNADIIIPSFAELLPAIDQLLGPQT